MAVYVVEGGNSLRGELVVQGSKNAALPLMAAAVINRGCTILHNCPRISDVYAMIDILREVGCKVTFTDNTLIIDGSGVDNTVVSNEASGKVRGSFLIAGAMLARTGEVKVNYPGGCYIGARPVNYHLSAFREMNVQIDMLEDGIGCRCEYLQGADVKLPFPSVGATENALLAGAGAHGITRIHNAAREPEVEELCELLQQFGVIIEGLGTSDIVVEGLGKEANKDVSYIIKSDRIVAGTYAYAAAITGGSVTLGINGCSQCHGVIRPLRAAGCEVICGSDYIRVHAKGCIDSIDYIKTEPYPGFPTDMQSQLMVLLSVAKGCSVIEESIFENRFHIAEELLKMGADIRIIDDCAYISGVRSLTGSEVTARDLRGGAALIIAGLAASGKTRVLDAGYIARGYENITGDIIRLGGNIQYEQKSEDKS